MFPFGYNPYLSMFEQQQRQRQEQQSRRGGFLLPRTYGGELVPEESAKRARAQGLIAFGLPLLQVGTTGDYGGALAQAAGGMNAAMQGVLEEERQIGRQREDDRLRREEHERSARESDARLRNSQQDFDITAAEHTRAGAERDATAERVRAIARQVESTMPNSPEAEKARALSDGPNAHLFEDEINRLQEQALERSRRDEDAQFLTDQKIRDIRDRVAAGVEEDPLAQGRRAEEGLRLERERIRAYEEGRSASSPPTTAQYADDVRAEQARIFARKKLALEAAAEGRLRPPVIGPDGVPSMPPKFTDQDLQRIDREAMQEAEAAVRSRYESGRGGAPAVTVDMVQARKDRPLTPDERAEVEQAIKEGFTIEQILRNL